MPIMTIEPEGINSFTADGQWEEIELSVDSGATESVVPEELPMSVQTAPGPASKRGVQYEVANGARIPNEGRNDSQHSQKKGEKRNESCRCATLTRAC